MIAAASSFTGPWRGPEFGSRIFCCCLFCFVITDVAFQGYQAGNSRRPLLSPAGRGHCFLQSPSQRQLPPGQPDVSTAGVIFRGWGGLWLSPIFSGIWLGCGGPSGL